MEERKDICEGYDKDSVQQLDKLAKDKNERFPIYPLTYIQAVYDAKTKERLDTILWKCNNVYLPWMGSAGKTRIQLPFWMRRKGIMITYKNLDEETITEKLTYDLCIADDFFRLDSSWTRITDALPVGGNITIGSNGNWFQDGVDTGFKAQGPKGDNGQVPHLRLADGYVRYSYDEEVWYDLFPLIDITPGVKVGEVTTLPAGSKASVTNVSGDKDAIFNFGIPIGNTGAQGQKGDTTTIKGRYDTQELLRSAFPNGDGNNAYLVGVTSPYELYLYMDGNWVGVGSINEVKAGVFDGGRADSNYGGTRTIDCGGADAYLV